MGKKKDSDRIIHIHAKCDQFEIFEYQPENKAEARLKHIKDLYINSCTKGQMQTFLGPKKRRRFVRTDHNKLIVNTVLINPTLL